MDQKVLVIIALLAIVLILGIAIVVMVAQPPQNIDSGNPLSSSGNLNTGNIPITIDQQQSAQSPGQSGVQNGNAQPSSPRFKEYDDKVSFYTFQDQNEGAFTIKIPGGWQVLNGSGLIRPYIDAGVMVAAYSQNNQGFIFVSPVAAYTIPNGVLDFAGFTEGTYYDASGGIAMPMLVKRYTNARDYLGEYIGQLNVETQVVEVIDRPDLINGNPGPLITRQSAAEMTYIANPGPYELRNKLIAYNYLVEMNGMGIWVSSMFGYYSPEGLFNETEYLVLKSAETLKVDAEWAKREAQEMNKRLGIISNTQESISETIASTFEYRSETMDRINDDWSRAILGIEEVYDPSTEDMFVVDSGSKYYWINDRGDIYGTDTYENPPSQENWELMDCPGCDE